MKKIIYVLFGLLFAINSSFAAEQITVDDIIAAQDSWAEGIENIGKVYMAGGDYQKAAEDFVDEEYNFAVDGILFKPTKAKEFQFRPDRESALSYFVGGDKEEDKGFALNPWSKVRFDDERYYYLGDDWGVAMGNYYFTDPNTGEETKAEYTFGYTKGDDNKLKAFLHHSSVPYGG